MPISYSVLNNSKRKAWGNSLAPWNLIFFEAPGPKSPGGFDPQSNYEQSGLKSAEMLLRFCRNSA